MQGIVEKPHKNLDVWNKSVISIPSNIAEGAARHSKTEFKQFVNIAIGSCSELDTQLELCHRLKYISIDAWRELDNSLREIDRMLIGLKKALKQEGSD